MNIKNNKLIPKKKQLNTYSHSESSLDKSYRHEFLRIKLKQIKKDKKLDKILKELDIPKVSFIK
jgi:hypothetical protein